MPNCRVHDTHIHPQRERARKKKRERAREQERKREAENCTQQELSSRNILMCQCGRDRRPIYCFWKLNTAWNHWNLITVHSLYLLAGPASLCSKKWAIISLNVASVRQQTLRKLWQWDRHFMRFLTALFVCCTAEICANSVEYLAYTRARPATPLCPPLDNKKNTTLRIIAPPELRGAFSLCLSH